MWKNGSTPIERRQIRDFEGADLLQVRHQVAMGEHHALGKSGRPG
jgi:hypothetical protein